MYTHACNTMKYDTIRYDTCRETMCLCVCDRPLDVSSLARGEFKEDTDPSQEC